VSFNGGPEDNAFETEQSIDLSMFKDYWILADRKTEQDLIKATMDVAQSSNRISRHLGTIEKSLGKAILSPQTPEKPYEHSGRSGLSGDLCDPHQKHRSTIVLLFLLLGAAAVLLSTNAKSRRSEGGET
jgi:hypothetical protein